MGNKLTLDFVKSEYSKKNYEFLDDFYKNANHPHNIKCLTCDYKWKQCYGNFSQGSGCPSCSGKLKHTLVFIKQEYSKRNYAFLDDYYKNCRHKHNIKCLTCGYEWKQSYGCLQQEHCCPKCADKIIHDAQKLTLEFVKEEYSKRNYEFLDGYYNNARCLHNIKCLTCGYEWKQTYGSLQQEHGCPNCLHKNEQKCREILEKLTTYKFLKKQFSKKQTGLYQIELDGFCQELNLAFEYDGEQHYKEVSNWNKTWSLEKIQARDQFKTNFCLDNNIKLIRIPYFIKDKEEFIKNELNLLKIHISF